MNMQNPADLLQMMSLWNRFQNNHPKFPKFLSAVMRNAVKEDSIIEIKVTTADGECYDSNLKISADDMEMIRQLREMPFGR